METIVQNMGTLGGLLTAKATFSRNPEEDEDGFVGEPQVYLTDEPCMAATGRNTRQDGLTYIAIAGSLPFESKWSAVDLNDRTRNAIKEEDRVSITQTDRLGNILSEGEYIVAGVTEYDAPVLGFAVALLTLKEPKI